MVLFICIFLMMNTVEHSFMYLLAFCVYSFEKISIQVLSVFWNLVICFFDIQQSERSLQILNSNLLLYVEFAQIFYLLQALSSLCSLFCFAFQFDTVPFVYFCFSVSFALRIHSQENPCLASCRGTFLRCFLLIVLWFPVV